MTMAILGVTMAHLISEHDCLEIRLNRLIINLVSETNARLDGEDG